MSLCLVNTCAGGEFIDTHTNTHLHIQMCYKTEIPGNCRTDALHLVNIIPILPCADIPIRYSFSTKQKNSRAYDAVEVLSNAIKSSQFWGFLGWQVTTCCWQGDVLTVNYQPKQALLVLPHSVNLAVGRFTSLDFTLQYDSPQLQSEHLIAVTEVAFRSVIKRLEYQLPLVFTHAIEKIATPRSIYLESIHQALSGHKSECSHDDDGEEECTSSDSSYSRLHCLLLSQASQIGRASLSWKPEGRAVNGTVYKLSFLNFNLREE